MNYNLKKMFLIILLIIILLKFVEYLQSCKVDPNGLTVKKKVEEVQTNASKFFSQYIIENFEDKFVDNEKYDEMYDDEFVNLYEII